MQYNGGALIGVEKNNNFCYWPGPAAKKWACFDMAWTPVTNYTQTNFEIELAHNNPYEECNCALIGTTSDNLTVHPTAEPALYSVYFANAENNSAGKIQVGEQGKSNYRYIVYTTDNTIEYTRGSNPPAIKIKSSQSSLMKFSEAMIAEAAEIPMPNLTSYVRAPIAPTTTEIKTMDGAIRRYVTGSASTRVSATWRWSENGQLAKKIKEILEYAQTKASPIIIYIPQGIFYDGANLDLVMTTNNPGVIMPAPGIYELAVEGTCQP